MLNKKLTYCLSWLIIGLFTLLGLFFTGILLHELSHKQHFKEIEKDQEELCILNWGGKNIGYYSFIYPNEENPEVEYIGKTTELNAYLLKIVLCLLFLLSLYFLFKGGLDEF